MVREDILNEIDAERAYQDEKFGHSTDDSKNTPWMWVAYVSQYATRWMRGAFTISQNATDDFRKDMIKVAALAVAAVESIDRQRETDGKPFYQE